MRFEETLIAGCYCIDLDQLSDERGWFARVFCAKEAESVIGKVNFVQINHSFNLKKGTFRGMHYQSPPYAEAKLVRCISGAATDYILDIRRGSPTFLKFISVELSAHNRKMVYIPKGLAHGFQTLEDNTELLYHHTEFYVRGAEGGVRYNDPLVNVKPTFEITVINEKDLSYPLLSEDYKGIEL